LSLSLSLFIDSSFLPEKGALGDLLGPDEEVGKGG